MSASKELVALRNLGVRTAEWLGDIGITTRAQLAARGAVSIYRELKARGYPVTSVLLYAIEGALMDVTWTELPAEVKQRLVSEARA